LLNGTRGAPRYARHKIGPMTVLIDQPIWPAHNTVWAHIVSDHSLAELHEFAAAAGLPRHGFDLDHYDVPAGRWQTLVDQGAVPVRIREFVRRLEASGLRVHQRDR
jgi:hypothetical protein